MIHKILIIVLLICYHYDIEAQTNTNNNLDDEQKECCPDWLVKTARGAISAITIDLSVPEPTDAIPVKWVTYGGVAIIGGTIVYLSSDDKNDNNIEETTTTVEDVDNDSSIRIALGTDQDLNDFSAKVGALPYHRWDNYMPNLTNNYAYVMSLIKLAETFPNLTFHFNLTDGGTGNRIDETYQNYPNKITSHEFKVVSTLYKHRTTFYVKSGSIYKPTLIK